MDRRIIPLLIIILFIAGCGGSGGGSGGSIKSVYKGSWVGKSTNLENGYIANMRVDMAYEGDDGFGNERVSLAWYVEENLFVIGVFYGTHGGLVYMEVYDVGIRAELLGNINGNTMTGTFEIELPTEAFACTFVLHRL